MWGGVVMECSVCKEEVDSNLELVSLGNVFFHMKLEDVCPSPVHVKCIHKFKDIKDVIYDTN